MALLSLLLLLLLSLLLLLLLSLLSLLSFSLSLLLLCFYQMLPRDGYWKARQATSKPL